MRAKRAKRAKIAIDETTETLTLRRRSDVDLFSKLPRLRNLTISCVLANLEALSTLSTTLERLDVVVESPIFDLTPLIRLTNLTHLRIAHAMKLDDELHFPIGHRGPFFTDLAPLASLTKLEDLVLASERVTLLTPLSGLTQLTRLHLTHAVISEITDLEPLSGLTKLRDLVIPSCDVYDLSPLSHLTALTRLTLGNNGGRVSQLAIQSRLLHLEVLDVRAMELWALRLHEVMDLEDQIPDLEIFFK